MSMALRNKFQIVAGVLLLAFAAFALAATAVPAAKPVAQAEAEWASMDAAPKHAPACVERHYTCLPDAAAAPPAQPSGLTAVGAAGFIKVPALMPALVREASPHPAAPFSILFRNFRE